jgi:hypoxanthine phosphoribosyltransferase
MADSATFVDPDRDSIRHDLDLLVSSRERGLRLVTRLPQLLQVRVPEDPLLVGKPLEAVVPFLNRAIVRASRNDQIRADAMRILLGRTPDSVAKFKTERCADIGDLYARHGRSPRSGKVIAVKEAGKLLESVTDAVVALENEAIDWRERNDVASKQPTHESMEWDVFERRAEELGARLEKKLDGRELDALVAIARGGLPLCAKLAHSLGVRNVGIVRAWKCPTGASSDGQVLDPRPRFEAIGLPEGRPNVIAIVDDLIGRGRTMQGAKRVVQAHYAPHEPDFVFGALRRVARDSPRAPLPDEVDRDLVMAELDVWDNEGWLTLPWEAPAGDVGDRLAMRSPGSPESN